MTSLMNMLILLVATAAILLISPTQAGPLKFLMQIPIQEIETIKTGTVVQRMMRIKGKDGNDIESEEDSFSRFKADLSDS